MYFHVKFYFSRPFVYFLPFTYFLRTFVIFNPFKEERNSGQDIRIASCTTPNVEEHKSYQSIFSILIRNDQWSPTVTMTSSFSGLKSANLVVFDEVRFFHESFLTLFVRHRPHSDFLQDVRTWTFCGKLNLASDQSLFIVVVLGGVWQADGFNTWREKTQSAIH